MAAESTTVVSEQAGNGVKVAFDAAIKILAKTDLLAYRKSAAGVYTPLVLDSGGANGFTVVFDTAAETLTATLVTPPATGGTCLLVRSTAKTQGTSWPREGKAPAKTTETAIDKLTLLIQEFFWRLSAVPAFPETVASPPALVIETPVDRRALVYSDNGDGTYDIVPSENDPDVMVIASAASAAAALASQTAAAASAAAALASQTAAAASAAAALASQTAAAASASAMVGTSGLFAARPAGGAVRLYYYATDQDQEYEWSPVAAKWYLKG